MICKYEDYLKEPYVLTIEQMQQIHNDLLADLDNDPEALELYEELIAAATKYAAMRAKWLQLPRQEKMDTDSLRTSHHDSVITHFNMLARYLRMQGKKAAWRDALGDEKANKYGRKTIGDFACYLVFMNSICVR